MAEDIRWVKTHCARMDHGGCTLLVGVQDNRIVKIKGDPTGFLSKGYTCIKGLASADKLNHPERLRYPLKRAGKRGEGKWKRVSWDEALKTVAQGLLKVKEQYGAKDVAFGVGMPKGLDHFIQIRLANLFGSPNIIASQDVCHAPREITGVHTCGFYPVADLHYALERYAYRAWISSLPRTPAGVWHYYDGRAGMEPRIRELREDFALRKIPTRAFAANALYLEVVRLAYNLVTAFQRTCVPEGWRDLTLSKLRHKLFWLPGELTRPQNRPTLRLAEIPENKTVMERLLHQVHRQKPLIE